MATDSSVVHCGAGDKGYDICVGQNKVLEQVGPDVKVAFGTKVTKFVLLSDTNVGPLYGQRVLQGFMDAYGCQNAPEENFESHALSDSVTFLRKLLPPGEFTKCREMKAMVEDWMLGHLCNRDTLVLALGGGVIGDFSGYVAATYMRGVPVVQIPTSMLAMNDSSIGGKTGIDSPAGKNLLGAFHQPFRVYIDISVLKTLPKREVVNGMAEVIKHGAIYSEELFELLENKVEDILSGDAAVLKDMILRSVSIKAHVVTEDEKEGGLRAILNWGHSVGHGIEGHVWEEYLHGECVAIGCLKEAEIARALGHCNSTTIGRLVRIFKSFGLPTRIPLHLSTDLILDKMAIDKKNRGGVKKMVMLLKIGKVHSQPYTHSVDDNLCRLILSRGMCVIPSGPVSGSLRVPGSKSLSNRMLLMTALGRGTCRMTGLLHSDDTQVVHCSQFDFAHKCVYIYIYIYICTQAPTNHV
jgi:pentafunctional AROM polypeptide